MVAVVSTSISGAAGCMGAVCGKSLLWVPKTMVRALYVAENPAWNPEASAVYSMKQDDLVS